MNILLTSAGRRSYLVQYFKEALRLGGCGGLVHAANSCQCPAFACADRSCLLYTSRPLTGPREAGSMSRQ